MLKNHYIKSSILIISVLLFFTLLFYSCTPKNNDEANEPILDAAESTAIDNSDISVDHEEPSEPDYYIVNTHGLRIRKEQSLDAEVIGSLESGTLVQELERSETREEIDDYQAYWHRVSTINGPAMEGWVYGGYLSNIWDSQIMDVLEWLESDHSVLDIVNQRGKNGRLRWGPEYGGYGLYMFWYSNGLCTIQSPQSGIFGLGVISQIEDGYFRLELFPSSAGSVKHFEEISHWNIRLASGSVRYRYMAEEESGISLFDLDNINELGTSVMIHGAEVTSQEARWGFVQSATELWLTPDGSSLGEFNYESAVYSSYIPHGWSVGVIGTCAPPFENLYYVMLGQDEFARGPDTAFVPISNISFNLDERPENIFDLDGFVREVILIDPDNYEERIQKAPTHLIFFTLLERELWQLGLSWLDGQENVDFVGISTSIEDGIFEFEQRIYDPDLGPFLSGVTVISREYDFSDLIDFSMTKEKIIEILELNPHLGRYNSYRITEDMIILYGRDTTIELSFEGSELLEVACLLNI